MEVEIISKDCIKPSSPTPLHLKNHKFSFLDVHSGYGYIPLVLYYPVNQETNLSPSDIDHVISVRLQILKQSLSETLSRFYPFAGKIKDSYSVDCNDEGVYFVEAKVNCFLNEFLSNPDISFINKFIPDEAKWNSAQENYVAGVQATTFACGGIVVGVYVSHSVADGAAFSTFLRSWSAIAYKNTEEIRPKFDASSFFPHNDAYPREEYLAHQYNYFMKLGKYITRRYVFDASATANLKAKATSSRLPNPTRVELVTALFGKCITRAVKARSGSDKSVSMTHAVNLRRKAKPQFSEYYMGNFILLAPVVCKDKEVELGDFVCQMKESVAKLNGDFVSSLQGDGGWINYLEAIKHESEIFSDPENLLFFTSWCNFGLNDVDFGWGKPAWVSNIDQAESNFLLGSICLMDTRERDGIEAWAFLVEEDVVTLESDTDFIALAAVNPSPLK
ncbi:vinorine synthase-like [Melia azedarach]|uniref:Vinorine synthase-like n=1 Tax=Melia azedarach TaxID=155640 RepID=A0ACC1YKW0_MELAZ|nr:vinorine synthase-like [Melia azedarach]